MAPSPTPNARWASHNMHRRGLDHIIASGKQCSSHNITIDPVLVASDEQLVDKEELERFFSSEYSCPLRPPCFSWQPLRTFMGQLKPQQPCRPSSATPTLSRCLSHRIFPLPGGGEPLYGGAPLNGGHDGERKDSGATLVGMGTGPYSVEREIHTDRELMLRLATDVSTRLT